MHTLAGILHLTLVGFISLFPAVNPVGSAFMIEPFLGGLTHSERKQAARRISMYCLLVCLGALFGGTYLLKLFGISIPVVQVAGGLMICKMGWQFLSLDSSSTDEPENKLSDKGKSVEELANRVEPHALRVEKILFYPLAFPITTGAGTISVLLTLTANAHAKDFEVLVMHLGALFISVLLMCLAIYLCYAYTPFLLRYLGARGQIVINRLSAFIVFCVGIQIAANGLSHMFKDLTAQ
jgi:multiple antibiotic resistance protein